MTTSKQRNDKRVEAIEQEKGKLAGQVETLNGKLSELENLKSDLEKELLELKRPAGGAQNKLATEHKEAFVGFLRKGREDGLRDLERKALQVGTDEDGGYAVPEELDRNILNLLKDEVVMRRGSHGDHRWRFRLQKTGESGRHGFRMGWRD